MNSLDLRKAILLSLQRALVGEIFPAMRNLSVKWHDNRIHLTCVSENELSDEDQESLWEIEGQFQADLPPDFEVETEVIIVPERNPIPHNEASVIVYRRRELNNEKF